MASAGDPELAACTARYSLDPKNCPTRAGRLQSDGLEAEQSQGRIVGTRGMRLRGINVRESPLSCSLPISERAPHRH